MNTFVLYNYFRSSASYRVRIALNLKQIRYDYKAIHLINNGGEQHSAEYGRLNPSHDVPTLVHNGKPIGQSVAIIEYLDEVETYQPLFPKDPYKRALIRQACEIVNSGVQPLGNLRPLAELSKRFGATDEQKRDWSIHWIDYGFRTLENFLVNHAGKFSFGDEVTAADCFVMAQLYAAERFNLSLEPYPTLKRIHETCSKIEAFRNAHPDYQPDSPKKT